ncbi:MAG: hypothetical protein P1U34_02950 [Coxiellaceae bacterium]|nr:hypothetical protein [Coxiellaceae bacterium]
MRPASTIINELLVLTNKMYAGEGFGKLFFRPTSRLNCALKGLSATRSTTQSYCDGDENDTLHASDLKKQIQACRSVHSGFHVRRRGSRKKLLGLLDDLEPHLSANDGKGSAEVIEYATQQQARVARDKRRKQAYSLLTSELTLSETHGLFGLFGCEDATEDKLVLLDRLGAVGNAGLREDFSDRRLQVALSFNTGLLEELLDGKCTADAIRGHSRVCAVSAFQESYINKNNIAELVFSKLTRGLHGDDKQRLVLAFKDRFVFKPQALVAFRRLLKYPEVYSDLDDRRVRRLIKSPASLNAHLDAYEVRLLAEAAVTAVKPELSPEPSPARQASAGEPTVEQTLPVRMMSGHGPQEVPSLVRNEDRPIVAGASRFTF